MAPPITCVGLKENVIIGKLIPAGTGLEQRKQLREKQRQDRLTAEAMATAGLGTLGMGGGLGDGVGGEPFSGNGYEQDLGILDNEPES